MRASLTRRGRRWVARYGRSGLTCELTADTRQDAAEMLHEVSGVWLGLGKAPTTEVAR